MENLPFIYEYQFRGSKVFFDFGSGTIELDDGMRFPIPPNLHSFCVVLGGLVYGVKRNIPTRVVSVSGPTGEKRKTIMLKKLGTRRKEEDKSSGENSGENSMSEEVIQVNGEDVAQGKVTVLQKGQVQTKEIEKAVLAFFAHEYRKSFIIGPPDAFALWNMLREKDKSVGVGDLIFEKREGVVYIQGIPIFYQKAQSLFFILDTFLRTGEILPFRLTWELGSIEINKNKRRLGFFKKNGEEYLPAGVVNLTEENALRIMSVL